ncbi:MAG: hypothetical protein GC202_01860 [Alphaproteobacteria bacterium]|nr:hypothetical protein [Alphaproteobacteria bacterium]
MPEVRPLPACARGHVTFGCFSRSIRLNEPTLRAWAGILARLPSARLALNTRVFEEDATRTLFARRFAEYGGDPARVDLSHTKPQSVTWAAYGDVDVALDPFPHNAGATTFEALWMGVPVVSKRDRIPLGRFGASILGACGLDDWVVDDVDAYVNRAVAAVSDLGELSKLRAGLRMRMANSPLCDHAAFAGDFAEALRSMWAAYCSSN